MDWQYIILMGVTIILFAVGLVGTVFPILPGIPLIWLGTVIFAIFTHFEKIGYLVISVFTLLMIFSIVIDYMANLYGAKKFGAGRWGIACAVLGMIIGVLTLGLIGLLVGPLIGVIIGELLSGKDFQQAFKAGIGTLIGFLSGTIVKFMIGLIMIGVFIWQIST